jgi:hypothetical protein
MSEFCDCYGKWMWLDLGARPVSSSRGLHIIGPMRALASLRDNILVSLPLCFKLEHFIIYVFLL